jgi:RNA polymerase sigma-70 factor (ECF subfamily)
MPSNIQTPLHVYRHVTGEAAVAISDRDAVAAPDRLGVLFETYHRRLYVLARRLSSTADEARDLVQETFLRAAQAQHSIPAGAPGEEAWLVRVLINLCRDQWRRRSVRQRATLQGAALHAAGPPDAEAAAVARSIVWGALRAIAPRRRAVLVMHELEGIGVDAIALTLGLATVTVRWHLSRGRQQLAKTIREQDTRT